MRYVPHTESEIQEMLGVVGQKTLDDLFATIPPEARFERKLALEPALAEPELMTHLAELAKKSQGSSLLSFLGAGMYQHHVPPAVDQLLLRSEFYTAYTPYQPEVAQGTLQAIWEFQTIVSELYGLPLANASLYDGASATAEAALMACRLTKRGKVLVSGCVHPDYRDTTHTYLAGRSDMSTQDVAVGADGAAERAAIAQALSDEVAAVIVGYPSFYGALPDLAALAQLAHERGALLVAAVSEPYALSVVEAPGALGADIAVGEGQPLACPPQFGGPGVGLFACRDDRQYLQQLPGRICGETVNHDGERGFVLTLSTREQHIRRERATSNICTNQGLLALSLAIRSSLLGKAGFVEVGKQCLAKARYLRTENSEAPRLHGGLCSGPLLQRVRRTGARRGRAEGLPKAGRPGHHRRLRLGRAERALKDRLLIAVTEKHRREDLDRLVRALAAV